MQFKMDDEKIIPYRINFSLEDILSKIDLNNSKDNPTDQKYTSRGSRFKRSKILAVSRNVNDQIVEFESDDPNFESERRIDYSSQPMPFGSLWRPKRQMENLPLFVSDEKVFDAKTSVDYDALPDDFTSLLSRGVLRTSGIRTTDYSVLMSVAHDESKPPEGRTGILLKKGKPVVVNADGRDFLVEIKGVGCPDGDNTRILQISRSDYFGQGYEEYGGFDSVESEREFDNLEMQRKEETNSFVSGEAIRAAGLILYKNQKTNNLGEKVVCEQGYLIRLTPSNIRASFNSNPNFPEVNDREKVLARSVGRQYAELAKLEEVLLHSTIHPENMVWTGREYVLTDFADCRKISEIKDPHDFLKQVLEKIEEVPGLTKAGVNLFYKTIADELGVEWKPQEGYNGFIDNIWAGYFAQRTFDARKGDMTLANKQIKAAKKILRDWTKYSGSSESLDCFFVNGARNFLEREVDMLQHIEDPVAQESLMIARQRLDYLKTQIRSQRSMNAKFRVDPNSYYNLYVLPYMKKDQY